MLRDVASLRHKVDSLQRENIALSELEKEYKLVKEQVGICETRVHVHNHDDRFQKINLDHSWISKLNFFYLHVVGQWATFHRF